jgi:hypothetical protein
MSRRKQIREVGREEGLGEIYFYIKLEFLTV